MRVNNAFFFREKFILRFAFLSIVCKCKSPLLMAFINILNFPFCGVKSILLLKKWDFVLDRWGGEEENGKLVMNKFKDGKIEERKTFFYIFMLIDVVVVHFSSNCRLLSRVNSFYTLKHLLSIKFTRANWQSINQVLNHY